MRLYITSFKVLNIFAYHRFLGLISAVFEGLLKIAVALHQIWCKLSILDFKLVVFEGVAAFFHVDAADGDDEAAVFLLEGPGVQEIEVLGAAELLEQGEVVLGHVS